MERAIECHTPLTLLFPGHSFPSPHMPEGPVTKHLRQLKPAKKKIGGLYVFFRGKAPLHKSCGGYPLCGGAVTISYNPETLPTCSSLNPGRTPQNTR